MLERLEIPKKSVFRGFKRIGGISVIENERYGFELIVFPDKDNSEKSITLKGEDFKEFYKNEFSYVITYNLIDVDYHNGKLMLILSEINRRIAVSVDINTLEKTLITEWEF